MLEKFEQTTKGEKYKHWEQKRKQIEQITDATGRGIDNGIKETVIAFNVNEIFTSQSCEGHSEVEGGHRSWPWVEVSAPDEPEEKFVGEKQAFEEAAHEHNIPFDELKRGYHEKLYWGIKRKVSQNPYTLEYQKWQRRNQELHTKIVQLLDEFYQNRETETDIRLHAEESNGEPFEISSEREMLDKFLNNELGDKEKESLLDKLSKRQREMRDFAEFLKKRYLGE